MTKSSKSKNRLKIRIHYFIALILLIHCGFFLVYWFAVGDFRADVDQFIGDAIGFYFPYTDILMVITALIGSWSLIRFLGLRLAIRKGDWKPAALNWVYFGLWVFFLIIFYASFTLILMQNPSQRGVLYQLLNLTRLGSDALLFLFGAIWLRRLIVFLRLKMQSGRLRWLWMTGIALALIVLVGLWLVPPLFPPNWAYQGDLPAKPALIAHRGASMLAPENTLAAAELAAENGALGFETDLRISLDGVPFLMHDETLARTTNIAELSPERVADPASSFTMDELKELNAGLWFIQTDPFGTIRAGLVSQTQLSINQSQWVPTLLEALELVDREDMVIIFDMRYPPKDHPYYDRFFDIVLTQCLESGLNGDIWFLVDRAQLEIILEEAPRTTRVLGATSMDLPDAQDMAGWEYEIINVDIGIRQKDITAYREQRLGVNVYTVDQPWLFSQLWLSGVTSVTTNNIQSLSQLGKPSLNLPYSRYLLFWSLFGIIVAIWLASSQPDRKPEPVGLAEMQTPDLMDFVEAGDDTFNVDDEQSAQIGITPEQVLEVDPDDE